MTSQPDNGQITEPGLRGGTFLTGGSCCGAFFGAGAALGGAAAALAFFAGGAFFLTGAGLAGFVVRPAFPVEDLAPFAAVVLPAARFAGAAFFAPEPLVFLAGGRFAAGL